MMIDTLRVGIIGCGNSGRQHISRLLGIPGVKIVGLCDPSEDAWKKTARWYRDVRNAIWAPSHKDLLEQVELDAVVIASPHVYHYEQIIDALDSGVHVLCEKPMVCKVEHAKHVVKKVEEAGVVFGIAYQRHCMAQYRYCRDVILSGEMGECRFISGVQSQNWYSNEVPFKTWRAQKAYGCGGQIVDSGSHMIDAVLWITGLLPDSVFAFANNLDAEVDILTSMSVRFSNGAIGSLAVVGYAVNWFEDLVFWCDNGVLEIRGDDVWRWHNETTPGLIPQDELGETWSIDANFIDAIRGNAEIEAPAKCGLLVAQLTEAALLSAETRNVVQVEQI